MLLLLLLALSEELYDAAGTKSWVPGGWEGGLFGWLRCTGWKCLLI